MSPASKRPKDPTRSNADLLGRSGQRMAKTLGCEVHVVVVWTRQGVRAWAPGLVETGAHPQIEDALAELVTALNERFTQRAKR